MLGPPAFFHAVRTIPYGYPHSNIKLTELYYRDPIDGIEVGPISFDEFTLLVGASGVGKTTILNAALWVRRSALSLWRSEFDFKREWNVAFETDEGTRYEWGGKFSSETMQRYQPETNRWEKGVYPEREILKAGKRRYCGKKRGRGPLRYLGRRIPNLSPEISLVSVLRKEKQVAPIYSGWRQMDYSDYAEMNANNRHPDFIRTPLDELEMRYNPLEKIRNTRFDDDRHFEYSGFYFAYKNRLPEFDRIRNRFCEIFPFVEDVLFVKDPQYDVYPTPAFREIGVDKPIEKFGMSAGMLRTLVLLSELHLCPDGTVFLIDEFENGLGVNCIDELTNELIVTERKLQFVITSHHPYIINKAPPRYWKLVTRNAGKIKAQSMEKYRLGNSKHELFMQLLQLKAFQTGREE